jgi:hypothetical protein
VRNGQIRLAGDKLQLVFILFLNIALDFCYLCNDLYTRYLVFEDMNLSLFVCIGARIH